jgi:hypothetical protein
LDLFGAPPGGYSLSIEPWPAGIAQERYVQRFHLLSEAAGLSPAPAAFDTE